MKKVHHMPVWLRKIVSAPHNWAGDVAGKGRSSAVPLQKRV